MRSQRGADQHIDPVCLSSQLIGIIVAHRLPVHVVSFNRCDTSFHFCPFPPTSHCVVCTFTSEHSLVVPDTSSSHSDLVLVACQFSPCFPVQNTVYASWSLSCFLATICSRAACCAPFSPSLFRSIDASPLLRSLPIYVCSTLRQYSVLVLVLLSVTNSPVDKYTRFKPLGQFPARFWTSPQERRHPVSQTESETKDFLFG